VRLLTAMEVRSLSRLRGRAGGSNEARGHLHCQPGGRHPGGRPHRAARAAGSRGGLTMSQQLLYAFVVFAAVMYFTPGPNNVMLLSSGLTYGFRRTLPHIAGIVIGMAFMIAAVGVGL